MIEFIALAEQCGSQVEPAVMASIVATESNFNPYAIGVVDGSIKQPRNYVDAVKAVRLLRSQGKNFSVGLAQVNKVNFATYNLNERNMFDPCTNLRAGSSIFAKCLQRADNKYGSQHSYDGKLRLAMSCYYSGNFKTGFKVDFKGQPPYVTKVYSKIAGYRNNSQQLVQPKVDPTPLPTNGNDLAAYAQNAMSVPNTQVLLNSRLSAAKAIGAVDQGLAAAQKLEAEQKENDIFNKDVFSAPSSDLFGRVNPSLSSI